MTDALTWAGTFHGIGARLLRDYAPEIGLDPAFSIHDREDSADLMNLVRHELGFSTTQSRFPAKATCLAIYSRCVNAEMAIEEVLRTSYPVVRRLGRRAAAAVRRLCRGQAAPERARLRRPPALLGADGGRARDRRRTRRALRPCPGRRVPGHQPAPVLDPARPQAGRPGPHGGRRRCPVDLFLPRGDGAQHPGLPDAVHPAGRRSSRSTATTARPSRSWPRPMR